MNRRTTVVVLSLCGALALVAVSAARGVGQGARSLRFEGRAQGCTGLRRT